MRGGVSLAVWIGGAVAELDILRRIRIYRTAEGTLKSYLLHPGPAGTATDALIGRAAVYADLLRQAKYDDVEFDILAGASAGGLNSVMYAVAQRAGAGMDPVLGLWQAAGGIGKLLRPLGCHPVESLLQGEDHLREEIGKVLNRLYAEEPSHPQLKVGHITVDLSATVIDSESSPNPEVEEGRGNFHFEGHKPGKSRVCGPADTIPPIGSEGGGTDGEALTRLAYAARTTSSFPGAFEPAEIYSVPTPAEEGPEGAGGSGQYLDMRFVFDGHRSNAAAGQKPFRVIDGGIFDNIPIERALRAARTRSSDRHADRALIYLNPDPLHAEHPGRWDGDLRHLVPTLFAAAKRMRRRESDATEERSFYEFRDRQLVAKGRQEALAQLLHHPKADLYARRGAYIRYRSTADVEMLNTLLTNPSEWQLTSTLTQRQTFTPIKPAKLEMLPQAMINAYADLVPNGLPLPSAWEVLRGPQAFFDSASCILSWVRYLERLAIDPGLPAGLAGSPSKIREGVYDELQRAVCLRDQKFLQLLENLDTSDLETLAHSVTERWLGEQAPVPDDAWGHLDDCVANLQGIAEKLNGQLDGDTDDGKDARWKLDWAESSWHALTDAGGTVKAADLPPAFCATTIPPAVSNIMYWRITGDERPEAANEFCVLQKAWQRKGLSAALRYGNPDEQLEEEQNLPAIQNILSLVAPPKDELPAKAKLAGIGLLNFRGFLSEEWRRNDWIWGRMDAAAGMARFLRQPPGTPSVAAVGKVEVDVQTLQDGVLADHGMTRASMSAGADSLGRLSPAYRLSLLSRGIRVLNRALAGTPRVPRAVSETALFLLQPLFVVVPALADPPRAVLIAALIIGGLWLSVEPLPPAGEPQNVFLAAILSLFFAAAFIALLFRTMRVARGKWSRVEVVGLPTADASKIAEKGRTAIRRALVAAAASSLPVLVLFWLAMRHERWGIAVVLLLALSVIERLAATKAISVPIDPPRNHSKHTLPVAITVLAVMVLLVAHALPTTLPGALPWDQIPLDDTWVRAGVLAAAVFLAGIALTFGWLRFWPCLAAAFLGALPVVAVAYYIAFTGRNFWLDLIAFGAAIELWAAALWWVPVFFRKAEKPTES